MDTWLSFYSLFFNVVLPIKIINWFPFVSILCNSQYQTKQPGFCIIFIYLHILEQYSTSERLQNKLQL